jgi:Tfp pilus assembly protein PilN
MRTHINLSKRPFTNHRLFWITLAIVYLTCLWMLLWITSEKSRVIAKAEETKQRIDGQKQLVAEKTREREQKKHDQQQIVVSEQQGMELAAARQLIQRRVFSWNRMIGDIEEYVPKNARILSVKVDEILNTAEEVSARVQVKAIATTPNEMTEMMLTLEKSGGLFVVGEAGQEPTTDSGETPFTLNLTYTPRRGNVQ